MDKKEMRQQVISMRNALDAKVHMTKSLSIAKHFFNLPAFESSKAIAGFVDFRNEVNMKPILQHICDSDISLFLPRIEPVHNEMIFYHVPDLSNLIQNNYGIWEPDPSKCSPADLSQLSIVLTPGVAFTNDGKRLGYGGGYYDRFFSNLSDHILRIGIAFDLQIVDNIPSETHDVKMQHIITETGIIDCS